MNRSVKSFRINKLKKYCDRSVWYEQGLPSCQGRLREWSLQIVC